MGVLFMRLTCTSVSSQSVVFLLIVLTSSFVDVFYLMKLSYQLFLSFDVVSKCSHHPQVI
jgi:hypothetical protein